ncbi:serine/threonine-protein kinase [Haliangium ochraceum]|uniref:Serine/threonine protein kinase n=1 Tax=Haliangium ochraceum (strain DSM 14365 / JCM 11303 / SMP-2) TaxID=502025 RepID=D0LU03_HALO1|nr:serine/threonine-protein kinase [Haliangium ochraceum]ACY17367.1 serine/threonine protein kinase [Haliangium ochraceum DSM 14365]
MGPNVVSCIGDNTLVEFVEHGLDSEAAETLERHLAVCGDCRQRLAVLGASPSRLAVAPTSPARLGAPQPLRAGAQVGRFAVGSEIGRGGMGVVFAARDPQLERPVAIKILRSDDGEDPEQAARARERFTCEARAMAGLDHPNIVKIYEAGVHAQQAYIAMEMIEGEMLHRWVERWRRSWAAVLETFSQAGRALAHAHDHGLAHGDFKPDNVLVDDAGRVRVTDFGLSRQFRRAELGLPGGEREDFVGGTPRYMAPEQFEGMPADALSDQFSFCVALYESLYERHPFAEGCARSLLEKPATEAMAPLLAHAREREVPRWLYEVLARGMRRERAARYGSMRELLDALAGPRRRARPRWPAAAAAAAMLLTALLSYGLGTRRGDERTLLAHFTALEDAHERRALRDRGGRAPAAAVLGKALDPVATTRAAAAALWVVQAEFAAAASGRPSMLTLAHDSRLLLLDEISRTERKLSWLRRIQGVLAQADAAAGQDAVSAARPRAEVRAWHATARVRPRVAVAQPPGLDEAEVDAGVSSRWRDLEVCFGEWRERSPHGRQTLAIRAHIASSGRAQVYRVRGLGDRVVRRCVSGALERAAFPSAATPTAVDLGFISEGGALDLRILPLH